MGRRRPVGGGCRGGRGGEGGRRVWLGGRQITGGAGGGDLDCRVGAGDTAHGVLWSAVDGVLEAGDGSGRGRG